MFMMLFMMMMMMMMMMVIIMMMVVVVYANRTDPLRGAPTCHMATPTSAPATCRPKCLPPSKQGHP